MQLQQLKDKLEALTQEHREQVKMRIEKYNMGIGYLDEDLTIDEKVDEIMDIDGDFTPEEQSIYELGQRDMLESIIWEMKKENQACNGEHESVKAIVQCPHCAKDIDNM